MSEDNKSTKQDTGESDFTDQPEASPVQMGLAGQRIGPYTLVKELGHGAQGYVYLADDDANDRQVALKILVGSAHVSRSARLRFEREAETASKLDHPGIAKVYGVGEHDGIQYIAFEYVKGKTFSAHISETADSSVGDAESTELHFGFSETGAGDAITEEPAGETTPQSTSGSQLDHAAIMKAVLFTESAAHALHSAHEAGLIHRDIKPGNLMIREDGTACVLDFGLAKDEDSVTETLTQSGDLLGTPAYMSSEQLLAHRVKLDRRTDIYSLGVCLFEACTLTRPFTGASRQELYQAIAQTEPPSPRSLNPAIPSDLSAIILTAMDKDRNRRYATAREFAEDLQRYRESVPVMAKPAGTLVKTLRWAKNNPALALANLGIIVALSIAAIVFYVKGEDEAKQRRIADTQKEEAQRLQRVAEDKRKEADEQRRVAEAALKRSETVTNFVIDALNSADPSLGGNQGMLVADAMIKANFLLNVGAFTTAPDIEAILRLVIAKILYRNSKIREALPVARRGLELYEQLGGQESQELATSYGLVATIEQRLGNIKEAEPLHEKSLAIKRRLHPDGDIEVAKALNNVAVLRREQGRADLAEPLLVESLKIRRKLLKNDDNDGIAMNLNNLAIVRDMLGREEEAAKLWEESLAIYERLYDKDPQLAMALRNVGLTRIAEGKLDVGEPMLERALAMYKSLFKGDHPDVARAMASVANIRKLRGRDAEAEKILSDAIAMGQRLFPDGNEEVAIMLREMATLIHEKERYGEEEPILRDALKMLRRSFPGDHPTTARLLEQLSDAIFLQGRAEEAHQVMSEALAMCERLYQGGHEQTARILSRMARILQGLGRLEEVEPYSRRALTMAKTLHKGDHKAVVSALSFHALALAGVEKFAESEEAWIQTAGMFGRLYGANHNAVGQSWIMVGINRDKQKRHKSAREAFDKSIAILKRAAPQGSLPLAKAYHRSAVSYDDQNDHQNALTHIQKAVTTLEKIAPPTSKRLQRYREMLAECSKKAKQ